MFYVTNIDACFFIIWHCWHYAENKEQMLNDDLLRGESMGEKTKEKQEVRISEKLLLSINEANALSGIGQNKLRELTLDPRCPFVLFVGRKRLIKRKAFEAFIDKELEI